LHGFYILRSAISFLKLQNKKASQIFDNSKINIQGCQLVDINEKDNQNKVQDAINGTNDVQNTALEELEDQISKVQDYLSAIADLYSQFSNTV
jgi:cell division protein FtsX